MKNLKEYKMAKSEFMKNAQAILAKEFKEWFDKHPNVDAVRWNQYTPHFNDGDECVFSRNEFDVRVIIVDNNNEEGTAELISGRNTDDDDFYDGWSVDDTPLAEALGELYETFEDTDDIFKEAFGDGVKVIATKKGFTTQEYHHA